MNQLRLKRRSSGTENETDAEGTWAISYGDMITLLLTFFILFFSIDPMKDKSEALQAAVVTALLPKDEVIRGGQFSDPRVKLGDEQRASGIEDLVMKDWGADIERIGSRIIVRFPTVSFYETAKTDVTPQGRDVLRIFTQKYIPYAGQFQLIIRSFADQRSVTPGRRFKDNLELSALRAVSAMRELQELGVPLHRMKVGGYGEIRKLAGDASDSDLALARKLVLVIEPELKETL
jgi:chemotaxis protein MotB